MCIAGYIEWEQPASSSSVAHYWTHVEEGMLVGVVRDSRRG